MAYEADHQTVALGNDRELHVMRSTIDGVDPAWVISVEHGGLRITVPLSDANVQDLFTALKSMRHRASGLTTV